MSTYENALHCCLAFKKKKPSTFTTTFTTKLTYSFGIIALLFIWYSRICHGPRPPSDILHLPPRTSLHSVTICNMELPQPGESRPVQSPSQRTISRQLIRVWPLWKTNIPSSPNSRILQQLTLRIPLTIHTTNVQDLHPRSCAVNDHPSVLTHEMMVIDPRETPGRPQVSSDTSWLVLMMIVSPYLCGKLDFVQV